MEIKEIKAKLKEHKKLKEKLAKVLSTKKDLEASIASIESELENHCIENEMFEMQDAKVGKFGYKKSTSATVIFPCNISEENLIALLESCDLQDFTKTTNSIKKEEIKKILNSKEVTETSCKLKELGFRLEQLKKFTIE